MQPVSQAWLNNQLNPVVTKGFLELIFYVANTDLYLDDTTVGGSHYDTVISVPKNIIEEEQVVKPQSLLGLNQFVLDGNTEIMNTDTEGMYADDVSDKDGNLSNNFVTLITLPNPTQKECRSIEIIFDENRGFAVNFDVSFNDDDNTVVHVTNNQQSVVNVSFADIKDFTTITISISKWSLPFQRPSVTYVFLGFVKSFREKDIISYSAKNSVSLDNGTLPTDEIDFEIDNSDGVFDSDPNNHAYDNIYKYLSSRQKVEVYYGYEFGGVLEWIKGGTFYLNEWNSPQGGITASFVAKNNLAFLSQKYSYSGTVNYLDLANDMLQKGGVSVALRDLDADLEDYEATIELNNITIAEGMQMIAQATNKMIWCDRSGIVHINDISDYVLDSSYPVNLSNCYSYPEISLDEEVKKVVVGNTELTNVGVNNGNEMKIDNGLVYQDLEDDVANYYIALKNKRVNYECALRIDPRIEPLDIVPLTNKNGSTENVIITGSTIDYNGAFSGKLEAKVW